MGLNETQETGHCRFVDLPVYSVLPFSLLPSKLHIANAVLGKRAFKKERRRLIARAKINPRNNALKCKQVEENIHDSRKCTLTSHRTSVILTAARSRTRTGIGTCAHKYIRVRTHMQKNLHNQYAYGK
ncbi:hypothetical protein POVWA2_003980 [Plasmodium ovale wallikeri]|uniref:Uncharacterized protein n=1 Tax=Plasmodium ovale wallikeri TaxID=864142 RepID=A0A1A8YIN5_PLAOA|nr:hypothetical protein POVWA1_003830 [Plasmodium ovale wallikeri]SBT31401.1 hypothetical protein POVWA2_003980 [Plasmodium ovale wallikeri]